MGDRITYYALQIARAGFGAVTAISEMDVVWARKHIGDYEPQQVLVHEWASGLTTFWGRGVFYMFQGLLTWASVDMPFTPGFPLGFFMLFSGFTCINLHFQRRPV